MVVSCVINELPDCILLRIFALHCTFDKKILWRMRMVCKRWYILLADGEIWKDCNLSNFRLDDTDLLKAFVQYIPLGGLRTVQIINNTISTEALYIILKSCDRLKSLQLNDCEIRPNIDPPFVPPLCLKSKPRNLKYVDIRRTKGDLRIMSDFIENSGSSFQVFGVSNSFCSIFLIKNTIFLEYMKHLTILECNDCTWVNDDTIRYVAECCPSLQALDVTKCLNIQGTSIHTLIRKCSNLENLILRRTSVREDEMLRANWTNTKITTLDVAHCYYIDDSACRYIVGKLATQLKYLCCAFTNELLQDLTTKPMCITSLELRRRHPLNMEFVQKFLSNCVSLEALDLSLSPIDFDVFQGILPILHNLRWIAFAGHEILKTSDSLSLLTQFCKCLHTIGVNYYHAPCDETLLTALVNFLVVNTNIKVLNLEGLNIGDIHQRLVEIITNDQRFFSRDLSITRRKEFALPLSELSVEMKWIGLNQVPL